MIKKLLATVIVLEDLRQPWIVNEEGLPARIVIEGALPPRSVLEELHGLDP